jgi:proteasome accessory factor B
VRTFNVGRILSLESLDESYRIPRGFSIDRHLRNAWRLIPEQGPDRDVVVRFSSMVADNVAEVAWHKTQRGKRNADGTLDFHVTVSGLQEISWWIMGYGDQAEVLQPSELRQMVALRAIRMAQLYANDAPLRALSPIPIPQAH